MRSPPYWKGEYSMVFHLGPCTHVYIWGTERAGYDVYADTENLFPPTHVDSLGDALDYLEELPLDQFPGDGPGLWGEVRWVDLHGPGLDDGLMVSYLHPF